MRLAEKTIELTFCSQLAQLWGIPLFFFGLTQRQEARAGFDAAIRLGGRLFIFQFKASSQIVRRGRRFYAPHRQMSKLVDKCRSARSVFYVLPNIGTTLDVASDADVVGRSWLLDVDDLREVPPPVTPWNTPRKNGTHYLDLTPPQVIIHDPLYERKVLVGAALPRLGMDSGLSIDRLAGEGFDRFWSIPNRFTGTIVALVVPRQTGSPDDGASVND
jgi:hypothetical protein